MIKVTALTATRRDPSSRYRIRQYIEPLKQFGVEVAEHYLPLPRYRRQPLATLATMLRVPGVVASRRSDITWFRREMIPERFTLERFTGGRRLFDVDDAVWLLRDSGFSERIVELCDGVIAGNTYLAEHYAKLGKKVWIVPTAIDTDRWQPQPISDFGFRISEQQISRNRLRERAGRARRRTSVANSDEWIIGWIGTGFNLRYLNKIEEPLAEFLTTHKGARLRVVCDECPKLKLIPAELCEFIRWSETEEVRLTQEMNVGLMPLEDTEWTRGKCGGKMITYLAAGVPVIVSPVGVNAEILSRGESGLAATTNDEWFRALETLYDDRALSRQMGRTGRAVIEEYYSVSANVPKLVKIFAAVLDV